MRYVFLNFPDTEDYKHLPNRIIHRDPGKAPSQFSVNGGFNIQTLMPLNLGRTPVTDLNSFLAEAKTTAFLIIRNDTMLFEGYYNGHTRNTPVKVFSISKNIISLLIGAAINDEHIGSVHDPVTKYITSFNDRRLTGLTIQHCLSLTSGIRADEGEIWPWNTKVRVYYSPDIRNLIYGIKYEKEPGKIFHIEEMTPVILGLVLENATGRSVSAYLEEKMWKELGMESDALWVTDSRKHGFEAANSGLTAIPADLARIARLCINNGRWNDTSVIPEEWIRKSTQPDSSSLSFWKNISAYKNSNVYFNDMWWGLSNGSHYEFSANGHFGQRIYIVPDKNLILLRFGASSAKIDWTAFMQEMAGKL